MTERRKDHLYEVTFDMARSADKRSEVALNKIESHETSCFDRHTSILTTQSDIKNGILSLEKKIWNSAIGIVTLLISVVGVLAYGLLKTGGLVL